MNAQLSDDAERFIHSQVQSGRYRSADEVIEEALRLMRHRERAESPYENDEPLQRRLLEAGLLAEIKPPTTDPSPYRNRKAIPIEGEPLSETVIRERR